MSPENSGEPSIVERPEQPYVAIKRSITMGAFAEIADRLPEVFAWLGAHAISPAGPPFFKYNVIDMERELEIEAGVPTEATAPVDGELLSAVLPAGRFVTTTHVGHPDELMGVTGELLSWAAAHDLTWDSADSPAGERWGCRLEVLHTNPDDEPDMNKWTTELVFRLAD